MDSEDKLLEIESLAETVQMAIGELEREFIGKDKTPISFTMLLLLRMIEELRVMVLKVP